MPMADAPLEILLIAFGAGLVLGGFSLWLLTRISGGRKREEDRVRLTELTAERNMLSGALETEAYARQNVQAEKEKLQVQIARLEAARENDDEKLRWLETAQTQMREAFEALAGRTLETSTAAFMNRAQENVHSLMDRMRGDWKTQQAELRHLVDPLQERLTTLGTHVRELEQKREGAYQGLQTQMEQLSRAHAALQETTVTLAEALKSPTVRGQWGEIQLRRVVEMAGMVRHVAFAEQVDTGDGRPDMVIHLPGAGVLPVDAKVPLAAYLSAVEARDETVRKAKYLEHARAVQDRVRELSRKRYWDQFEQSPDFVVMFIPNEACLGAAFETDPGLLEYAVTRNVLITTPVTLIALLRSVAFGWQQYRMTENARQISEQGRELYKRFETFTGHLIELGRQITRTVEGYNRAVGSLDRRLTPLARRFQEMGVGGTEEPASPDPVDAHTRQPVPLASPDRSGAETGE